jgi:caffeoyl-CoA O-methyltransferase
MMRSSALVAVLGLSVLALRPLVACSRRITTSQDALNARVTSFLDEHRASWDALNIPKFDGQILHDIILKNGYKSALEIRTSAGPSSIWMAWAVAKTGGRLLTVEIDEGGYRTALKNFQDAGLGSFVRVRLADPISLVPTLSGPFDFVFIDADMDSCTTYSKMVLPKLRVGGCLTAHDFAPSRPRELVGTVGGFYDHLRALPYLETTMVTSGAGLAVSYKARDAGSVLPRHQDPSVN